MNRFLWRIPAVVIAFAVMPLAANAETWFQEAKRIRQEADLPEPRSNAFEILPDCELAEKSVRAGATFKNKGARVIVRHARIRVELPVGREKGGVVYKYRTRDVSYNGEPEWSGHWREPWSMGFFNYTVTATYKGNVYVRQFKVGKSGLLSSNPT